jgi:hypothetical protein
MPREFNDSMNDDAMMSRGRESNPGLPPPIDRAPVIPIRSDTRAIGAPGGASPPSGRPIQPSMAVPNPRYQEITTANSRHPDRWAARREQWARHNRYQPPAIQPGTTPQDYTHRSRFHPREGDPNRLGRPGTREAMWNRARSQNHFSGPWRVGASRWRPFQNRYKGHYDSRHHSYRDPRYRPGMVRFVRDSRVKGGNSGYYQILGNVRRYDDRPRGAVIIKGRDGNRYYAVKFRRGDHGFGRHGHHGHGHHMGGMGRFGRFGSHWGGGYGGRVPPAWDRGGWNKRGGRGRDRDWDDDEDDDDDDDRGRRRRRRRRHRKGHRGGRGRYWGPPPWMRGGRGRPPRGGMGIPGRIGGGPISWRPPAGYV